MLDELDLRVVPPSEDIEPIGPGLFGRRQRYIVTCLIGINGLDRSVSPALEADGIEDRHDGADQPHLQHPGAKALDVLDRPRFDVRIKVIADLAIL